MKSKLITLTALVMAVSFLLVGCMPNTPPFDEEAMKFVQLLEVPKGTDIAKIETSKGNITVALFKDEAPNAVENFITLAKEGYYNNQSVFSIQNKQAFMTGSHDPEGKTGKSIFKNKPFKNEISYNMWPFTGAVCAISNKKDKADSRYFVVGNGEVTDEIVQKMKDAAYPERVIEKFKEVGGAPGLSLKYTIFGQVIEGIEVVNEINKIEVDEKFKPKEEVKIIKVEITQYEGKTPSSSSSTSSNTSSNTSSSTSSK